MNNQPLGSQQPERCFGRKCFFLRQTLEPNELICVIGKLLNALDGLVLPDREKQLKSTEQSGTLRPRLEGRAMIECIFVKTTILQRTMVSKRSTDIKRF